MRNIKLLVGASLVSLGLSTPLLAQTSDASSADTATDGGIEEIIVTASRRESSIREIPTAISAYAGEKMAESHVQNLVDLIPSSPNVTIGTLATNSNVTIRGIGYNLTTAGSEPGVAIHFDGVYLSETGLAANTFLDVERVEVLRGPQGTLFGRNATGGAVNIIPKAPTAETSYSFDASLGFDPYQYHLAGHIGGALTEDGAVMARLSAQRTYNRGFTDNLVPTGPNHLDNQDNYSVRGQLTWQAAETFSARLLLQYEKAHDNGPGVYLVGQPPANGVSGPSEIALPADLVGLPDGNPDKRQVYANQGDKRLSTKLATLVTDWDVGGGNLKGTFSFQRSRQSTNAEGDGRSANFTNTLYTQDVDQYFNELIYTSDDSKPFTFILGGNYFHSKVLQTITVPISFLPVPVALTGDVRTNSYAGFVHGQYAFDSGLRIFAGARLTHDSKKVDETNNFIGALSQKASWTELTYEVGASYDLSSHVTGYIKYATGYKGGGFSAGGLSPAFDPEKDRLIEAGLKGNYLDGALQANLAVFHTTYDDLQVAQVVGVLSQVTNAAKARVYGAELETLIKLSPALRLQFSAGYLNAKFKEFFTADSSRPSFLPDQRIDENGNIIQGIQLKDNYLPQSPKYTMSAGFQYDLPIDMPGVVTFNTDYNWRSKLYFNEFNLNIASQKANGRLNMNLMYRNDANTLSFGVFARNLTDETVKASDIVVSSLLGSLSLAEYQPGREIGVSLHLSY